MKVAHPLNVQMPWGGGPTRTIQFRLLAGAGHRLPRHGPFTLLRRLTTPLVVYEDESLHRGEGKRLWRPADASHPKGNLFCSEFVGHDPDPETRPVSMRRLIIGNHRFDIRYTGAAGEWRSNVGGDYEVLSYYEVSRFDDLIRWPMYAIDMVEGADGWVAVDLNYAPGMPLECVNWPGVGRQKLKESVEHHWHLYRSWR